MSVNSPEETGAPADTAQADVRKLDPALKARWLEALRSDQYQQGRMALKTKAGSFCCLGVALDVIDSGQWKAEGWGDRDYSDSPRFDMQDTSSLGRELGIDGDTRNQLATWNDGVLVEDSNGQDLREPWTFAQIADWIEENL